MSLQEFNTRFLLAIQSYIPKVAKDLLRQCREDIELEGLEYAERKWRKFLGIEDKGRKEEVILPTQAE